MEKENKNYFTELYAVDVSSKVEKKNGLTYLSWCWAWAEVCKRYPTATYEVVKFNGLPYVFDEATGYMVYTRVTIEGITREMWLPVMDSNNFAMKNEPYEVVTKYKKVTVKPATMFDINKTIMRCLTKNLAVACGLGLYIYAGEDLPETESTEPATSETKPTEVKPKKATATKTATKTAPSSIRSELVTFCKENKIDIKLICKMYKLNNDSTDEAFKEAYEYCKTVVRKRILDEAINSAEEVLGDYPTEV